MKVFKYFAFSVCLALFAGGSGTAAASLSQFLVLQGWTWRTALCLMTLCMFHWPCLTTCRTIRRETGSLLWTAAAVWLPTLAGLLLCACLNRLLSLVP